jgi:hypothetical protein
MQPVNMKKVGGVDRGFFKGNMGFMGICGVLGE